MDSQSQTWQLFRQVRGCLFGELADPPIGFRFMFSLCMDYAREHQSFKPA